MYNIYNIFLMSLAAGTLVLCTAFSALATPDITQELPGASFELRDSRTSLEPEMGARISDVIVRDAAVVIDVSGCPESASAEECSELALNGRRDVMQF